MPPDPVAVVLLVDDEPDVLTSVSRLIEAGLPGVRVVAAVSGRTALELMGKERVDLIVSDFRMEGMDGIEFLCIARRQRPEVRRAILSAYGNDAVRQRAFREAAVESFFSKAADPQQFVQQLGRMLDVKASL